MVSRSIVPYVFQRNFPWLYTFYDENHAHDDRLCISDRSCSHCPAQSVIRLAMLCLDGHLLVSGILPYITLDDLLSLRQVCKGLRNTIDLLEWDRRYYHDFPYDSIRLAGQGMDRYAKRFCARLKPTTFCGSNQGLGESERFRSMIENFSKAPIVDFGVFEIPGWIENEFEEIDEVAGISIRCLDGNLFLETEEGVPAVLDTSELSELRISSEGMFLRATKRGIPVECDLRGPMSSEKDPEQLRNLEMLPDVHTAVDATTERLKAGRGNERLTVPSPLEFYQDNRNYIVYSTESVGSGNGHSRSVGLDRLMQALVSSAPTLETLYCPRVWVGAGSNRNVLYTVRDENHDSSSSDPVFRLHAFTFAANIASVGSYYSKSTNCHSLVVLDDLGNLYGKWYQASFRESPAPSKPQLLYEDVADLVDNTLLMKDGSVRCFSVQDEEWHQVGSNAVLITTSLYLQVV